MLYFNSCIAYWFSGIGIVDSSELDHSGQILPYLITNHLTDSGLLYGVVGAGALAAAMSSSDAITHGASVSFEETFAKHKPKYQRAPELWIMRGAVFGVGFISYFIAIFGSDGLIQLLLGAYGPIAQLALSLLSLIYKKPAKVLSY